MYGHLGNNPWFWSQQLYMLPLEEMLNLMMGSLDMKIEAMTFNVNFECCVKIL